jgi:hypothetical protein
LADLFAGFQTLSQEQQEQERLQAVMLSEAVAPLVEQAVPAGVDQPLYA